MQVGIFLGIVLLACSASGQNPNPINVTIVVLGRSGTGISSTVKQLLGPTKSILPASGTPTLIQEFEVPINPDDGQQGYIKILDVEGFVDGKSIDDDAETLSSLKFYLSNTSGLNGALPNFFLVVSSFEDNRLQGKTSLFTQTLKRVEILQKALYKDTSPTTVFLLTKFLASTKTVQRRPRDRIQLFRDTIREETDFKEPIEIVLGENRANDYGLKVARGYSELPNKELYPKNVFDKLVEVATSFRDLDGANGIQDFVSSREKASQVHSKYCDNNLNDKAMFLKTLHMLNSDVQDNELNRAVQVGYDSLDDSTKARAISDLMELQAHFQAKGLTTISQLPKTTLERVEFFQNLGNLNSDKLAILKAGLSLEMPELIQYPLVGQGYDALQDIGLEKTPFMENSLRPSPIGYQIPDFLTCSKLRNVEKVDFGYFSETLDDYRSLRATFLDFQGGEGVTSKEFEGYVRSGFNLRPEDFETLVTLSTVQEVRVMECKLNDGVEVNEEFRDSVNALKPFNSSDKDSVGEWKAFFRNYGTHVVTRVFGGGQRDSSVSSPSLLQTIKSKSEINETLETLSHFGRFSFPEKPSYRFFGGIKDERLENTYDLEPLLREQLIQSWTDSLNYDPILLPYDLTLAPISVYAKLVDPNLGMEVDRACRLLLSGNLVYKRPVKKHRPNRPTARPYNAPQTQPPRQSPFAPPTETIQDAPPTEAIPYAPPTTSGHNIHNNFPSQTSNSNSYGWSLPNTNTRVTTNDQVPQNPNPYPEVTGVRCPNTMTIVEKNTPTSPPQKEILRDYTDHTVGQGYHMLKEIVLPNSPFKFGGGDHHRQSKYQYIFQEVNFNRSCERINNRVFSNREEYIEDRLRRHFKVANVPTSLGALYQAEPLPGTVIRDSDHQGFKFEVQRALGEKNINKTIVSLYSELSPEFETELFGLPSFTGYPKLNCEGRMMWKRFFDKWGTHYVNSTDLGYSYEVTLNGVGGDQGISPASQFQINCQPLSRLLETGLKNRADTALKSTFTFVSYSSLINMGGNGNTLYISINEAMFQLMSNGLSCS